MLLKLLLLLYSALLLSVMKNMTFSVMFAEKDSIAMKRVNNKWKIFSDIMILFFKNHEPLYPKRFFNEEFTIVLMWVLMLLILFIKLQFFRFYVSRIILLRVYPELLLLLIFSIVLFNNYIFSFKFLNKSKTEMTNIEYVTFEYQINKILWHFYLGFSDILFKSRIIIINT